ncbi:CGNR zinc finger domain-containing protein [Streptomyces sp. 24-1644]|uniref:CGNR zinc finger domain-containing protein n=1 Tax=Streptomyces sp. 24-1644 TaxID=3457315 RepID=UPI003FA7A58D
MPQTPGADPRPLTGEPLALDLLNTRWIDAEGRHDLLETVEGLAVWLAGPAVRERTGPGVPADATTLARLLRTRAALDTLVVREESATPEAAEALNGVLAHGHVRRSLGTDGLPHTRVELEDANWAPAWHAADSWLELLADRPGRIRPCANDACILHFYDISKNGTRRWCSMSGCGNRAKAQRHYARRTGA